MAQYHVRNEFFDALKGVGILCVFYGHTARFGTLQSQMIFSFHMPLFFLISGIFFDADKIIGFGSLIGKVWKNLLLPYCFFVFIGQSMMLDVSIMGWLRHPLLMGLKILHGEGSPSIWFLVCLSVVQILTWSVHRVFKHVVKNDILHDNNLTCVILALVGLVAAYEINLFLPRTIISRMPFMLASVPSAMVFFSVGQSAMGKSFAIEFGRRQMKLFSILTLIVLAFALLAVMTFFIRDTFNLRVARFPIAVLPSCIFGVVAAFLIAKLAMRFPASRKLMAALGRRSLYLFSLELPLSYLVAKLSVGRIPCWLFSTPHSLSIEPIRLALILVIAFVCSYPAEWGLMLLRSRLDLVAVAIKTK